MAIDRVILDFDHTLFDADDFKVALASSLRSFGVTDELFWGTYRHARDTVGTADCSYRFEKHIDLIAKRQLIDKAAATAALENVIGRAEEFLFPDTKDFLTRLISLGIPGVLLTRGDPEFQKTKITACGIDKLLAQIIATEHPKSQMVAEIIKDADGIVYFINDHLDETLEVHSKNPSITPILKRRADQPPERYLGIRMLNFRLLSEIRDYITIVHATNPRYAGE